MRRAMAWVLMVAWGSLACGGGDDVRENAGGRAQAADTLADGEILGISDAINRGAIEQANAALMKLADADARAYADLMLSEHTTQWNQQTALSGGQGIAVENSPTRTELLATSQAAVAQLQARGAGPSYDRLYLQTQVGGHTAALNVIDQQLLPSVENEALEGLLGDLRAHVLEHMSEAEDVMADLP